MESLETDRLRLRQFVEDDLDAFAAICADPLVMRYIGDGQPLDRAGAWRSMALSLGHWRLRGYGLWAAEEKATGALVGRIGLYNPEGWPGLEVGWLLGRPWWGRGFATEGGRAALDYAFSELNADRVISAIHPDNIASIRVAERLGETFERTMALKGREVRIYSVANRRAA